MNKSDLKNGMLVVHTNGKKRMVMDGYLKNTYISTSLNSYNDNLECDNDKWNIDKIYADDGFLNFEEKGRDLLWERTSDKNTILKLAIETYGRNAQMDMAIEEMSELTKALLKYRRAKNATETQDFERIKYNIAEEIADVTIMLEQLKMIFGNEDTVGKIKSEKIQRLKQMVDIRISELCNAYEEDNDSDL